MAHAAHSGLAQGDAHQRGAPDRLLRFPGGQLDQLRGLGIDQSAECVAAGNHQSSQRALFGFHSRPKSDQRAGHRRQSNLLYYHDQRTAAAHHAGMDGSSRRSRRRHQARERPQSRCHQLHRRFQQSYKSHRLLRQRHCGRRHLQHAGSHEHAAELRFHQQR